MPIHSKELIAFIDRFIANAYKVGLLGLAYALIALFLFFKTYDFIVNDICDARPRVFKHALWHYALMIILIPIVLIASFAFSSLVAIWIKTLGNRALWIASLLFSYLFAWLGFFLAYVLSPNKKTHLKAAIIASFAASLIWYIGKVLFLLYISFGNAYNFIYGSVAILMFFLLWIYISWAIFVYGLQFYAILERTYRPEKKTVKSKERSATKQ